MKKNSYFFTILGLIFCFSKPFIAYADIKGFEQSSTLFKSLQKAGSNPSIQNLIFNENNNFPYNIIDTFSPKSEKKTSLYKSNNNLLYELHIVFKVEDFYDKNEIISSLVKEINQLEKPFKISIDFTYGDDFSDEEIFLVRGSEVLTQNITEQNSAFICINLNQESRVITGGKNHTSPSFLIEAVTDSFFKNELDYKTTGGLVNFLYRYNFLKTDTRANVFFETGLPAISVDFCACDKCFSKLPLFIKDIIENIQLESTVKTDYHTIVIPIGNKTFLTGEKITIILYLLTALLSLFSLCELSFINKKKNEIVSNEVLKLWYIIPFIFAVTLTLLFLSELIVFLLYKLFEINSYIQIALKIALTFVISSFSFFFIIKRHSQLVSNAYSFFLIICSTINLLLFPAFDISLFYIFALEYFLVYLTRPEKHIFSLSASIFVLALPFAPYIIQILKYGELRFLALVIHGGFFTNIVISLLLIPFEIQWLRILDKLNHQWKTATKSTKHFYMQNLTSVVTAFVICVFIILITDLLIPSKYKIKKTEKSPIFSEGEKDILSVSVNDFIYFDELTRIINVKASENCEKISVCVYSEEGSAILYSDNEYISDSSNSSSYFKIPVNPPKSMKFRYIANGNINSLVKVTALQKFQNTENGNTEFKTYSKTVSLQRKTNGTK